MSGRLDAARPFALTFTRPPRRSYDMLDCSWPRAGGRLWGGLGLTLSFSVPDEFRPPCRRNSRRFPTNSLNPKIPESLKGPKSEKSQIRGFPRAEDSPPPRMPANRAAPSWLHSWGMDAWTPARCSPARPRSSPAGLRSRSPQSAPRSRPSSKPPASPRPAAKAAPLAGSTAEAAATHLGALGRLLPRLRADPGELARLTGLLNDAQREDLRWLCEALGVGARRCRTGGRSAQPSARAAASAAAAARAGDAAGDRARPPPPAAARRCAS